MPDSPLSGPKGRHPAADRYRGGLFAGVPARTTRVRGSVVRGNLVSQVSWFTGFGGVQQLVQLADLPLEQVNLLLLAKHRPVQFFEMVFAQIKLDFEFRNPGFHIDIPAMQ